MKKEAFVLDEGTIQVILVIMFLLFIVFYPAYLGLYDDLVDRKNGYRRQIDDADAESAREVERP